jgi:transposase
VATIAVTRRFDLTDEQWAALVPLLPVSKCQAAFPLRM